MRDVVAEVVRVFDHLMIVYFAVLALSSTGLAVEGWRAVDDYVRRRPSRDYRFVARSPLSLPVSILVPAHNEGPTIVPSVRSLLASQFVPLEVVVINDGSTDDTLASLHAAFDLVAIERVPQADLPSKPVRGMWVSPSEPRIVVIDKENGGKADALNAGLATARYPLVCAIDGDTLLDEAALSRLVWEFQADPTTVAAGGIVRIVNGSDVVDGRLRHVHTPKSLLENVQILEYLRAFLGARIGWSRLGLLLIISGAFGLFRRDALVAVGGYDTETVGEDADLVLRLHRYHRERRLPYRITFFPDPICWTEAPSDFRCLARQRDRWQRGLIEVLRHHRDMLGNPRYGRIGLVALPYFTVFELFGPLIELTGYAVLAVTIAFGLVSWPLVFLWLALAITHGFVLSFTAILVEERAFRRYPGWRCLWRLVLAAVAENLGYRQAMLVVRARAFWTVGHRSGWGEMRRKGFAPVAEPPRV